MTEANEALVYGFDPLCGWCFAFRPTMHAIRAANPDVPVRLMTGGLVVGTRVAPVAESRDYLIHGLEQVRRASGVVAGKAFYDTLLAAGTYVSNSEPPCRALHVFAQLAPAQAYAFADSLPEAFYVRGLPLDDAQVLAELVIAQGVDGDVFLDHWRSTEARRMTQAAFTRARAAGFTSYPTLVYQHGSTMQIVAQGFATPEDGVARFAALREQARVAR